MEKISSRTQKTLDLMAEHYYNIGQYRLDLWSNLKYIASSLEADKISKEEKKATKDLLKKLALVEQYWAFPGAQILQNLNAFFKRGEYKSFSVGITNIVRTLVSESYRINPLNAKDKSNSILEKGFNLKSEGDKHYFELLIADNLSKEEEADLKQRFEEMQSQQDNFIYNIVLVRSVQDAILAMFFNPNIQSCLIRFGLPFLSKNDLEVLKPFLASFWHIDYSHENESDLGLILGSLIRQYRPEVDLFYVTNTSLSQISTQALHVFKRIFYRQEDIQELHLSILRSVRERYEAPFFDALIKYSQKPTGVFHAMPLSRGNSIFKSNWAKDLGDFYGRNIFLAETSATTGGLDSLLQPTGSLKKAQEYAARAFGSKQTFFVTNGTSTANKIVMQALIQPGDIVLIDRDCHKSHHYGLVLSGAHPVYLDSYPIEAYSLYGAIPLKEIKEKLLQYKEAGRLEKVKMLLLTNCTFDGFVYNPEKVMEEVLAIKPDMIFLWDEAWFAYAAFNFTLRQRTAMYNAEKLSQKYKNEAYREIYQKHIEELQEKGLENTTLPNPDLVKIRVYATQSTHKTLTSFRQGSMIHLFDEDFSKKSEDAFHQSYMTHTSTSPNYQILASLDVGRRQVEFEGYELVERSVEMAMLLREKIITHLLLKKYFAVLDVPDVIPSKYRQSKIAGYYDKKIGWGKMTQAWQKDEFALDLTKVTLYIGKTGIDGDTFKREFLMNQFGIQINKTTRNTVLFMTNIGTTRSSVAYLVSVLIKVAEQIEHKLYSLNEGERKTHEEAVESLTLKLPPLPNFSYFHAAFRPNWDTPEGDMRTAYFYAYNEDLCEYKKIEECEEAIKNEQEIVSTSFVTPYPPGFPILVPGQVITKEILDFMKALDVKEIHSYRPELGFRVFKDLALEKLGYKPFVRKKAEDKKEETLNKVEANGKSED